MVKKDKGSKKAKKLAKKEDVKKETKKSNIEVDRFKAPSIFFVESDLLFSERRTHSS
jgi:hypothetical protein